MKIEENGPFAGLSTRAINVCTIAGLMNREDIRLAIKSGFLYPIIRIKRDPEGKRVQLPSQRNYGWKTHQEICKWVGLPVPDRHWGFKSDFRKKTK